MTLDELRTSAQDFDLCLIHVESISDEDSDMTFVGSLPEYFKAVKAIGSNAIFVSVNELSEDLFTYHTVIDDGEEDEDTEYDDDVEVEEDVDLCLIDPSLSSFKEKLGAIGSFDLSARIATITLNFEVQEDWWLDFLKQWSDARQIVRDRRNAAAQESEASEDQANELVFKKLRALIDDKQFVTLRTQSALFAYAVEKIPELETFTDDSVKSEIRAICAKLQARGLRR